jgi:hypothetical protein
VEEGVHRLFLPLMEAAAVGGESACWLATEFLVELAQIIGSMPGRA